MSGRLRCYSFHSVKGGVGKSTLSTLTALALARRQNSPVYLIDMDLTGTSLADVLPLQAPSWPDSQIDVDLDLLQTPAGFQSLSETKAGVQHREDQDTVRTVGVPYLNDYLLFATPDWSSDRDVQPEAVSWRLKDGPDNLRAIPSSALPHDLFRILPVIFDEEHSAFLESRLEHLLASLVPEQGVASVVIDVPPTIPGLSRAVLGLAIRLGQPLKIPLSLDGGFPDALEHAPIDWRAVMLTSIDMQDIRAMARWLDLAEPADTQNMRMLINRAPQANQDQRSRLLMEQLGYELPDPGARRALGGPPELVMDVLHPLIDKAGWLEEGEDLRIFRRPGQISDRAIDRISKLLDEWA